MFLVALESTSYPGTTDGEMRAVLEEGSGLRAGVERGSSSGDPNEVLDQSPAPGTPVWPGGAVSLTLSPDRPGGRFLHRGQSRG